MFKRLINQQSYDASTSSIEIEKMSETGGKPVFPRVRLKNIHLINILMGCLIFSVWVYTFIELSSQLQMIKKEVLVVQAQMKKTLTLIDDMKKIKTQSIQKDIEPIEDMSQPPHLKYMGVFMSGRVKKVLIETEQGPVFFMQDQMVDKIWLLKKIHEDHLILESKAGQQVTIYKEHADE